MLTRHFWDEEGHEDLKPTWLGLDDSGEAVALSPPLAEIATARPVPVNPAVINTATARAAVEADFAQRSDSTPTSATPATHDHVVRIAEITPIRSTQAP